MKTTSIFSLLAILLFAIGCNTQKKNTTFKRGDLLSAEFITSIHKDSINVHFPERKEMKGSIDNLPQYNIDLYKITYGSIYKDSLVVLSGLIVVPQKEGDYTHLQYHHGTLLPYNTLWGSQDAPSLYRGNKAKNHTEHYETRLYGNYFGSYGYLVSLPDYAGYGVSENLEHPYSVNYELAEETVDMILATREFAKEKGLILDPKTALSGWSEGGAISVATQKLIEEKYAKEIPLLANAPMSGFLNLAENFGKMLMAAPQITDDLGENLDYLAWTYYTYNKFSENPILFDAIFKIPVKNELDVLKNRPTGIPAEVFKVLDEKSLQSMSEQIQKNDLANWKPIAPLFIHHGTLDEIVPYANNPEVALKNYKEKGGNASLIKYEGHNHQSLGLLYIQNMIKDFEELKK